MKTIIAFLAFLMTSVALTHAQGTLQAKPVAPPWIHSQVDGDGQSAKICVAPADGSVHVVYGTSDGNLRWARLDCETGYWISSLVAMSPAGGWALIVDDDGVVHVSYNTCNTFGSWGDLCYARGVDGVFTTHTVDAILRYGYGTSIDIDDAGTVHICARQEQDGSFWYWYGNPGIWMVELIDANSNPGRYSKLRVDAAGTPHVAYSTWSPATDMRYASRMGPNSWGVTVVDATVDCYRGVGLDLDALGNPHVSYHSGDNGLYYAYFDGSAWNPRLVTDQMSGKYSSLGMDLEGTVHIVIPDGGTIRHITKHGDRWVIESVVEGSCGTDSLALDVWGRPYITWHGDQDLNGTNDAHVTTR